MGLVCRCHNIPNSIVSAIFKLVSSSDFPKTGADDANIVATSGPILIRFRQAQSCAIPVFHLDASITKAYHQVSTQIYCF